MVSEVHGVTEGSFQGLDDHLLGAGVGESNQELGDLTSGQL